MTLGLPQLFHITTPFMGGHGERVSPTVTSRASHSSQEYRHSSDAGFCHSQTPCGPFSTGVVMARRSQTMQHHIRHDDDPQPCRWGVWTLFRIRPTTPRPQKFQYGYSRLMDGRTSTDLDYNYHMSPRKSHDNLVKYSPRCLELPLQDPEKWRPWYGC